MLTLDQLENHLNILLLKNPTVDPDYFTNPFPFLRKLESKVPIKGYSSPPFVHSEVFLRERIHVKALAAAATALVADHAPLYRNLNSGNQDIIEIANGIKQVMQDGIEVHDQLRSESVSKLQGTRTEYMSNVEGDYILIHALDTFCRNDKRYGMFFVEFNSDASDEFHVSLEHKEVTDERDYQHIIVSIGDEIEKNEENFLELIGRIRACIGLTPELEPWEYQQHLLRIRIADGVDESLLLERLTAEGA